MHRDEMIEIAAKSIANNAEASVCEWDWCVPDNQEVYRSYAVAAVDALIAAGAIPGAGMVVVERGRWLRVLAFARSSLNSMRGTSDGLTVVLNGSDLDELEAPR